MDQKYPAVVKEYAAGLTDEDLKYVLMRLDQKFQGDDADALLAIQRHDGMDSWLKSANNYREFTANLDALQAGLEFEFRRRTSR